MPLDALTLSEELIRCPSITPTEGGALDLLQNRLEALGKKLAPDLACCILASDAVLRHCGVGFAFRPCGRHALPGRAGMVEVFALL